jgi:hypothetical protein
MQGHTFEVSGAPNSLDPGKRCAHVRRSSYSGISRARKRNCDFTNSSAQQLVARTALRRVLERRPISVGWTLFDAIFVARVYAPLLSETLGGDRQQVRYRFTGDAAIIRIGEVTATHARIEQPAAVAKPKVEQAATPSNCRCAISNTATRWIVWREGYRLPIFEVLNGSR